MEDPLYDDVKALLEKDFEDDRILNQILRACNNNEIISNFERSYVQRLAEEHLGRKPLAAPVQAAPSPEEMVPDVVIPRASNLQRMQVQKPRRKRRLSRLKSKKVLLGAAGILLVVIIAGGVSSGMVGSLPSLSNMVPADLSLSIKSDLRSYGAKDLISISGTSDTAGTVSVSITNPAGVQVWSEEVTIKNSGRYSTLVIAAGTGWEESGTYSLDVDNGEETETSTFSYTA